MEEDCVGDPSEDSRDPATLTLEHHFSRIIGEDSEEGLEDDPLPDLAEQVNECTHLVPFHETQKVGTAGNFIIYKSILKQK